MIVSSTALDLPEHRKEVMDACARQGMLALMMEHLPASDSQAIEISLKLVDEADIYVGVFAHRYGYVPEQDNPQGISITEMEYDRAVERGMPRLIFLIDKDHAIKIGDVEMGEGAAKLNAFKDRLRTGNIVNHFKSPVDLRAHVINSLSRHRQPDLMAFHYVSDIPEPPESYIAHPYTLLQTHRLVGRQQELSLLTDWVTKRQDSIYWTRIMNIVAIGGMGKSALTWKWFNDIAPHEMNPLAGRMWWSFYESDATFENFVTRALAYATRRPLEEVQRIPKPEREDQLLRALDQKPFLLVLDGLERILIAYARMDAAHLSDDDFDKETANFVAKAYGLPESAAQSFTGEHRLRKTADPRAGSFLRKLANVRASRILVSTRLYPADLQTVTGEPSHGCFAIFLPGLADNDALDLWRSFNVSGARESLIPLFNQFEKHPLLIQALASEVAKYRRAPGDYERWQRDHPDFNPFSLPLVNVKSHVVDFALRGVDDKARQVLHTIAAFRMPASYDTLAAVLCEGNPCADERELDAILVELEDRGLIGWDKRANRYDLHPIVRGVVWSRLGEDTRHDVYTTLHTHFEAFPKIDDWKKVGSLEDLTSAIELYSTLIGLGRYDDAFVVFLDQLDEAMFYRLSASRQRVELLEMLLPDGLDQLPRLSKAANQSNTLHMLALGYRFSGQPGRAVPLYRRANTMDAEMNDNDNLSVGLAELAYTLRLYGALYESDSAACRALIIGVGHGDRFNEAACLDLIGSALATQGLENESNSALQRALRIRIAQLDDQGEGVTNFYLAQRALWFGEFATALLFANRAWELADVQKLEGDFIYAARVQGEAALGLNNFATADERLHHALTRARAVNLVEEELPALIALAELRRRQDDLKAARELLDDVWEPAERGPYVLFHADAFNALAQIERDASNLSEAIEAATKAYRLAWCDGPPFAYHWGLEKARKHLRELGAPEPDMPPFDQSKFEPMPEVEIDPEDEFHAGDTADD
ncbi:MAG TPA: DUF4062 domain-containing protein [Blastocatellia bacterium]|nr:DUF4062 domain-containing protein [Blastocatellia bacterium]